MKRFLIPLVSFLVVAVAVPSLASAKGKDHAAGVRQAIAQTGERHDNGLHLGQLKRENKDKPDRPAERRMVFVRGTVNAISGTQLTILGSGTVTKVDAAQATIYRSFWQKIALSEVRVNDQVVIWGTQMENNDVVKALIILDFGASVRTETLTGTVVSGSITATQFKLQTAARGVQTVSFTSSTTFLKNGSTATTADLVADASVRVTGTSHQSTNVFEATKVEIIVRPGVLSFTGTVSAIEGSMLSITSNSVVRKVDASSAKIVSSSGTVSGLHELLLGDEVRVEGTRASGSTTVKASLITNLSLTSQTTYRIDMDDNNRVIDARVGDRVLLDLSDSYHWTVSNSNTAAVDLARASFSGYEGLYLAKAAGSSTLTLTGDPTCRLLSPACSTPSLLLRVEIRVR